MEGPSFISVSQKAEVPAAWSGNAAARTEQSRRQHTWVCGFGGCLPSSLLQAHICFSSGVVGHSVAATPGLGRLSVLMTISCI